MRDRLPQIRRRARRLLRRAAPAGRGPNPAVAALWNVQASGTVYPNELHGAWSDGWLGEDLRISWSTGPGDRSVEIELFLPTWVPHGAITVAIVDGTIRERGSFTLARGTSGTLHVPLGSTASGFLHARLGPSFQPGGTGAIFDDRHVVVLCHSGLIVSRAHSFAVDILSVSHLSERLAGLSTSVQALDASVQGLARGEMLPDLVTAARGGGFPEAPPNRLEDLAQTVARLDDLVQQGFALSYLELLKEEQANASPTGVEPRADKDSIEDGSGPGNGQA